MTGEQPSGENLTNDIVSEQGIEELQTDLGNIAYQKQVLEALILEDVDESAIGLVSAVMEIDPDPTLQRTIYLQDTGIEWLTEHVMNDATTLLTSGQTDNPDAVVNSDRKFTTVELLTKVRNIFYGIQQLAWARFNIDEAGVDPTEVKVVTQLGFYTEQRYTPADREMWLRVIDRIIPEVPGLDPTDPQTAIEIEQWLQ